MNKAGFYFHVYHNKLVTYCPDPDRRLTHIKQFKSDDEIPIRLAAMKRVPHGQLPMALTSAGTLYQAIWNLRNEAHNKGEHVSIEEMKQLAELYDLVRYHTETLIELYKTELMDLHIALAPDCPCEHTGRLTF